MIPEWFKEKQTEEFEKNKTIFGFLDSYRFLSNFHKCDIRILEARSGGIAVITYPSTENAYQAMKYKSFVHKMEIAKLSPRDARKYGQEHPIEVEDWDSNRIIAMKQCIDEKFKDEGLTNLLIYTFPCELVEGNYWKDEFWGVCLKDDKWEGKNMLGRILMDKRKQIMIKRGLADADVYSMQNDM